MDNETIGAPKLAQFSQLSDMNFEAQLMLEKKKKEIEQFSKTVEKAEEMLSKLLEEVREKTSQLEALNDEISLNESNNLNGVTNSLFENELEKLNAKNAKELRKIQKKHEEEMRQLKADFQNAINSAQEWANRHTDISYQEKVRELNQLNQKSKAAKLHLNELTFTKNGVRVSRAVDEIQKANSLKIAELETQISELTSLTREEIRSTKAKIDECAATIELRKSEHAANVQKLQSEASRLTGSYKARIEALKQQYLAEEEKIQSEIDSQLARVARTENLIDQIGRHHEVQLLSVNQDIQTIKEAIQYVDQGLRHSYDSNVRNTIRETQRLLYEIQKMDEESSIVDEELLKLEKENRQLNKEIKRMRYKLNH